MPPKIPEPTYEYEIARLATAYKGAAARIKRELDTLDLSGISNANARVALAEVARILAGLNEESAVWVEANVPAAARDGIARTIVALGVVETLEEAAAIVKFNRMNTNMVAAAVADTQADLLAVTTNIDRKVRIAVRQAVGESLRANVAAGINGRRTISRDTLAAMKRSLGDAVNTGIIDSAGRRWKPENYTEVVVRSKMMMTHIEATTNEALDRGVLYGVISRHGATDACAAYEGKIVRLTSEGDTQYPTVAELRASRRIFHPQCKHLVTPIRKPESLSAN